MSENEEEEVLIPAEGSVEDVPGGLDSLLALASDKGAIVVFAPDGMTIDEAIHCIAHPTDHPGQPILFMGDAPRTLPGGNGLVN